MAVHLCPAKKAVQLEALEVQHQHRRHVLHSVVYKYLSCSCVKDMADEYRKKGAGVRSLRLLCMRWDAQASNNC